VDDAGCDYLEQSKVPINTIYKRGEETSDFFE
jgi:hypothetical protein